MGIECLLEYGACIEHTDSITMADFDGMLQGFGGAVQATAESNLHQAWSKTTGERLHRYATPFTPSSEQLISTIKTGKLVLIGSVDASDIWEFDPTIAGYASGSWSQLDSNYQTEIGNRSMAWGGDIGGWFYIGGGWGGTDVYKTQNFTSWTLVGSLPSAISRISGCGCCAHDGLIHLIGGATRIASPYGLTEFLAAERLGHHYTFDGSTFTLVETDAAKFGHIWGDLASDGTNLWYARGYKVSNERGLLKSTDDGATFSEATPLNDGLRWFNESHRRGALSTSGAAYFVGGNFMNDIWKMS